MLEPKKAKRLTDYEIGYGKPPVHSRFQKGQSGNRRGRPPKRPPPVETPAEVFNRIMGEQVTGSVGGKMLTMTGWEALLRQFRNKAFQGDKEAARFLSQMASKLGILVPDAREEEKRGGVLVIPQAASDADWERRAAEQQAPYRGNIGDRDLPDDQSMSDESLLGENPESDER